MIENIIKALIVIVLIAAMAWLVVYVLGVIGFAIPQAAVAIIYVLALLLIILYLWRAFGGYLRL